MCNSGSAKGGDNLIAENKTSEVSKTSEVFIKSCFLITVYNKRAKRSDLKTGGALSQAVAPISSKIEIASARKLSS